MFAGGDGPEAPHFVSLIFFYISLYVDNENCAYLFFLTAMKMNIICLCFEDKPKSQLHP
jgi:hypothetical protein